MFQNLYKLSFTMCNWPFNIIILFVCLFEIVDLCISLIHFHFHLLCFFHTIRGFCWFCLALRVFKEICLNLTTWFMTTCNCNYFYNYLPNFNQFWYFVIMLWLHCNYRLIHLSMWMVFLILFIRQWALCVPLVALITNI
jgi:hypothetical protein